MKILMLWMHYPEGIKWFYNRSPGLAGKSYAEQQASLFASRLVGWPLDMAGFLNRSGIECQFVLLNAEPMQRQWEREQNNRAELNASELTIALEQIRYYKPDVLWIPPMASFFGPFLREARQYVRRIVLWCGSPLSKDPDVEGIDALLTENPATLGSLHHRFQKVIVTKPGFDPAIVAETADVEKKYDVTFYGQLSTRHGRRLSVLAALTRAGISVDVFGMTTDVETESAATLFRNALWTLRHGKFNDAFCLFRKAAFPDQASREWHAITPRLHAPVFGVDMYRLLAASRAVLNVHVDAAQGNAGNMRMFEVTGVGSCLVTEWAENISTMFEPNKEVLTYRDQDELVKCLRYLVENPQVASDIGAAGQRRVFRSHCLERMWSDIGPAFTPT